MKKLKLIWNDNGKHKSNSSSVSIREISDYGLSDVISPTDIVGTGSNYGIALEDFIQQFDEYIASLAKFRSEVLSSKKAYEEVISVDFSGNPLKL